ncbi:MAG TPA: MFS transporter, partial [Acidimicrobiales bacterium]|nr:MFS transporter [Acidimicrobiales bacterium]
MAMAGSVNGGQFELVQNERGRVFRVGESPKDLIGLPRWAPIAAAWVVMMMAGTLEYTFGAVSGLLQHKYGWSDPVTFWLLSVYVVFESFVSYPTGWLRERGILPARWAAIIGGLLCGVSAYLLLAHASQAWMAYFGYAFLGGIGSGMCYSTCVNIVNKWYPEAKGFRTGIIDGGWAYGALPFIIAIGGLGTASGASGLSDATVTGFITMQGIVLTVVIGIAGFFLLDPPKYWWPANVNPLKWSEVAKKNKLRDLQKNPPAERQLSTKEMWATPQAKWLGIQFALFVGSSLFGVSFYYPFAIHEHLGTVAAVGGFAGFGIADGVCRALYGKISEFLGRRQTMTLIYGCNAVFQALAFVFGVAHNAPLFAICAVISGGFSGANFALTPSLVGDYYGESMQASNYGTVYAWKALGGSFAAGFASFLVGVSYGWGFMFG